MNDFLAVSSSDYSGKERNFIENASLNQLKKVVEKLNILPDEKEHILSLSEEELRNYLASLIAIANASKRRKK